MVRLYEACMAKLTNWRCRVKHCPWKQCNDTATTVSTLLFFLAIADVFFQEGNKEYRKKELKNALCFYTEGINVNCKDDELNAKLYSNRATAHLQLGNYTFSFLVFHEMLCLHCDYSNQGHPSKLFAN